MYWKRGRGGEKGGGSGRTPPPCPMVVNAKGAEAKIFWFSLFIGVQGSEVPGSGGGECTHKRTHNVPKARKNGGGNGGKWGEMRGKGEKWVGIR